MEGINSGDTAWIIVATALVLMMTPALGFFYGGMVRRKNILSTLNLSFITIGLISIQWVVIGYTLAFGESVAGLIGGLNYIGLSGIGVEDVQGSIPKLLFVAFQMTFAIITPALISGTFVERIRFKVYLVFTLLWATLVYDPVCHWAWGGGIFGNWGALDFAGGTVVHITAGFSALAFAMAIRKRKGFGQIAIEPHNIAFTVLGAGLLWVGWFGFNGGSALAADGVAVIALVNTNVAAAAGALTWMLLTWYRSHKPSVLGAASGAIAGLVAITPAAGFVDVMPALIIGIGASVVSYIAGESRIKAMVDDALDVWAIHGMAGTWGALATGLFATTAVNAGGANGLFFGNPTQFGIQLMTVVVTIAYAFIITFILTRILDAIWGLAVTEQEEEIGLDISEHGERAYA
jgi:Amt family ammonium transporter